MASHLSSRRGWRLVVHGPSTSLGHPPSLQGWDNSPQVNVLDYPGHLPPLPPRKASPFGEECPVFLMFSRVLGQPIKRVYSLVCVLLGQRHTAGHCPVMRCGRQCGWVNPGVPRCRGSVQNCRLGMSRMVTLRAQVAVFYLSLTHVHDRGLPKQPV